MSDKSPTVSPLLSAGFRWYTRRYLRKHFHAVRIAGLSRLQSVSKDDALLCYVNHPSWWDPLLAVLVTESLLAPRQFYAPIAADALAKYRVFQRLGFYGLDMGSSAAAKRFLSITRDVLNSDAAVWLTPGGQFQDVRVPTTFQPGLGHLAAGLATGANRNVTILPVAFEYPFWQERTPEALVQLGTPIQLSDHASRDKVEWQSKLEQTLARLQAELAESAMSQQADRFQVLIDGTVGVGGIYDLLRRVTAALRGRPFDASHAGSGSAEPVA